MLNTYPAAGTSENNLLTFDLFISFAYSLSSPKMKTLLIKMIRYLNEHLNSIHFRTLSRPFLSLNHTFGLDRTPSALVLKLKRSSH